MDTHPKKLCLTRRVGERVLMEDSSLNQIWFTLERINPEGVQITIEAPKKVYIHNPLAKVHGNTRRVTTTLAPDQFIVFGESTHERIKLLYKQTNHGVQARLHFFAPKSITILREELINGRHSR